MTASISTRISLLASRVASEFNSVRGEISGLEQSIPTVDALTALFIEIAHPVGSWYASDDPTDPSVLFSGTTWQRLTGKRGLIACDEYTPVGTEGGSDFLTIDMLPAHKHTATIDTQGGHNHSRGDMNIIGNIGAQLPGGDAIWVSGGSGALFNNYVGKSIYGFSRSSTTITRSSDSLIRLDASRSWSGASSESGSHSHTVTVGETGSGSEAMNPYRATYIWKRIS